MESDNKIDVVLPKIKGDQLLKLAIPKQSNFLIYNFDLSFSLVRFFISLSDQITLDLMTQKKTLENISKILPSLFKNASDYLKTNFEENGKKIFENASGTAGVIIGLFAQPIIDKYFETLSKKKLENYGFNTYLKSAMLQATKSLHVLDIALDPSLSPQIVFSILNRSLEEETNNFINEDLILIYQPVYHPAVAFVRSNYLRVLKELNCDLEDIKDFNLDFNKNIENTIINEFGDDFEKHKKNIQKFILNENEVSFLLDTVKNGKIGFSASEELKYEQTYAEWMPVSKLRENENYKFYNDDIEKNPEEGLLPVEDLIEEYFNRDKYSALESILFLIADFGKGKSVFMRHYAAKLAKDYLSLSEGYFPVYLNLREFNNFSSETRLGVIADYLETKYSIKIDDEYFRQKKYFFLVDSLDESGDLNSKSITKVITSVKSIQNIDKTKFKTNRIIITSRPFDDGLTVHLNQHNPYTITNRENRPIPHFVNIYGFTEQQVNDWLFHTFSSFPELNEIKSVGFGKEIIEAVLIGLKIDIYGHLLRTGTLSVSELRRPIFAYMIYQLIVNGVDFISVGKLGVYLSFLNLLTKEAKHIHDINYHVNLNEEFIFRNILQATASLWMHQRHKGKQGMLNKADICRVLEGLDNAETDPQILERFSGKGITEIQFLSHSYFGENDNVLHFQHQSFAEILLAEYYLKIFIKYALDQDAEVEEARQKLVLGEPTEQTILFLKEMLTLLRETAVASKSDDIVEKRKLLFPLMASLSTNKHNRLFCNDLFYSWFQRCHIEENQAEYPLELLQNWCITQQTIEKISFLAQKILNSGHTYIPAQAIPKTSLYGSEIIQLQNQTLSNHPPNIDKWIALVVGNLLYNDLDNVNDVKTFNRDFKIDPTHLFEIIGGWNYFKQSPCPDWSKDYFIGIDMRKSEDQLNLGHFTFDGLDFSYTYFRNVRSWGANWSRCKLINCTFDNVEIISCLMYQATIKNIIGFENSLFSNCDITPNGVKIFELFGKWKLTPGKGPLPNKYEHHLPMIRRQDVSSTDDHSIFQSLEGFFVYGLQRSLFKIADIKELFLYEDEATKKAFYRDIKSIKHHEAPVI